MPLKNTPDSYGTITKSLHWIMALLVICLLAVGLGMDGAPVPLKFKIYGLHKSFGITVLALVLCRILWHLYSKKPPMVAGMKKIEELAAKSMHVFLYVAMIGMPLSGWLFSSAFGRTVSFFGLFDLPNLVVENHTLGETLKDAHEFLGYTLIVGVVLHAAAAIKHHFISKDATLKRMLPW